MQENMLSEKDKKTRYKIAADTRAMIAKALCIEDQDESSLMMIYEGYYLQISFTQVHPLIVIYFAKAVEQPITQEKIQAVNELNNKGVLGGHALNKRLGCYSYRATNWLDHELTKERFFEILNRCLEDANHGYRIINPTTA